MVCAFIYFLLASASGFAHVFVENYPIGTVARNTRIAYVLFQIYLCDHFHPDLFSRLFSNPFFGIYYINKINSLELISLLFLKRRLIHSHRLPFFSK